jgi:hypothetical protein
VEVVNTYTPPRIYPITTMEQEINLTTAYFPEHFQEMPRQTLVTKYFSPSKQEKEPPRDTTPLPSIRQKLNHIIRERE